MLNPNEFSKEELSLIGLHPEHNLSEDVDTQRMTSVAGVLNDEIRAIKQQAESCYAGSGTGKDGYSIVDRIERAHL